MTAVLGVTAPPEPWLPPPFLLSIDVVRARLAVHGELDRLNVHRLDEAIGVLSSTTSPCWSVEASGITFCDTEGLRGLVRARRAAHDAGRAFAVERPGPCLRRLLAVVGMDAVDPRGAQAS